MENASLSNSETQHPGLRVLVVEDDQTCAETMEQFLRLTGHAVRVAPNATTALGCLEAEESDVVLLDIDLPGEMDGYELARWIGRQPTEKRPFLVAVTGYGEKEDRRNSELAGIDLHLVKPVDAGKLQGLLSRFERIIRT